MIDTNLPRDTIRLAAVANDPNTVGDGGAIAEAFDARDALEGGEDDLLIQHIASVVIPAAQEGLQDDVDEDR